jgi:hypothetical protein
MLIKKYKTVKYISTLSNLNNIIKRSPFFCLVQVKHLNHHEWSALKQTAYSFDLNIFICKNTFLKSKHSLLNLPKHLGNNLFYGNLVILYSNSNLFSSQINRFLLSELFLKRIKICPLIFYSLHRFFLPKDFINSYKISKDDAFKNLIYILQFHSYNIINKLTLPNKLLLTTLNSKQT